MSSRPTSLWSWRVMQIRENFDAAFAMPAAVRREATHVLLVTVAGEACAVAMDECSLVRRAAGVTRLPSGNPSFRGLTTVAGAAVPVYDLAQRLGLAQGAEAPEWLLVSAGRSRVAFAVEAIDGYAAADENLGDGAIRSVVTVAGRPRRLVALAAIVDAIENESRRENTTRSDR